MKRKLWVLAIFVTAVAAGAYVLQRYFTLEAIAAQEARLRALLDARPLASFFAGLLAYTLLSFIPPTTGKSLIFGWLFGLWQGVLMANLGLTTAAVATFLVSRYVLREGLRSRFGLHLARLDKAIERDGAYYVFALRMMHAPYTFTNYAMGTTGLRTRSFWWSTQLGLLPGNFVFIYAGTQLPTLEQAANAGIASVFSPTLIAALVVAGLFPLCVRWILRRYWPKSSLEGGLDDVEAVRQDDS